MFAALLVLVLAGCVRFQANLDISPDDTVSGDIVVAVIVGDEADSREQAQAAADDIESQLLAGLSGAQGVTREPYDQDGYLGYRFALSGTPLSAFSSGGTQGALTIERSGDEFVFSGVLDFTPNDAEADTVEEDADTSGITVEVTFPGEVLETNGEVSGTTVRWETTYQAKLEMTATGSAIPSGPPAWVLPVVVGVAVVFLALIVVIVVRRRASS
ncbi:hypothetical protein BH10ACT7_BH10ACT7_28260 [soil metagenome]